MGDILLNAFLVILLVVGGVSFIMSLCFLSVKIGEKTRKPYLGFLTLLGPLLLILFAVISFAMYDMERINCELESESDCKCEFIDYECVCDTQDITKPKSPCDKE